MGVKKMALERRSAKVNVEGPAITQSATERRAAEAELSMLVSRFAPAHQRLVATMRRTLRKRLPSAHEMVYEYRDCFVISYSPSGHGYEGVLAIRGNADGVKLYFNQGKQLTDPDKLLKGSGGLVRFIGVEGATSLARPAVASLIDQAIARNRVPFERGGRGSVVVRSTAAKKTRRRQSG